MGVAPIRFFSPHEAIAPFHYGPPHFIAGAAESDILQGRDPDRNTPLGFCIKPSYNILTLTHMDLNIRSTDIPLNEANAR